MLASLCARRHHTGAFRPQLFGQLNEEGKEAGREAAEEERDAPSPARPLGLHTHDGRTLPTPRGARGVTPPPIQSYLVGCTYVALR